MSGKSSYEDCRIAEIAEYAASPPTLIARGFGRALAPASKAAQAMIPVPMLRSLLRGSHSLARMQFHERLPQPEAGQDLQSCDSRARRVEKTAMALAGGIGAATGVGGAWGVALDTSLVLTLALACVERTACCYGLGDGEHADADLAIGIFALASANTVEEKKRALRALDADPESLSLAAARDGLERAVQRQVAKDTVHVSLTQLAQQLSLRLGQRKAGQLLPFIGSAVGLTVNALYLRDVARAAQQVCAMRYLIANPAPVEAKPLSLSVELPENRESSALSAQDSCAAPKLIERRQSEH